MKHMILFSLRGLIVLGGGVVQSGEQIHRDHRERRGVVETVRDVQSEGGRTTGAGVIIGAVVGAVAGSHIGSGRGSIVGSVVGSAVGGLVGNAAEHSARRKADVELSVRLDEGRTV